MQFGEFVSTFTEWAFRHTLSITIAILIMIIGWAIARFTSQRVIRRMTQNKNSDKTMASFIAQIMRYAIYVISTTLALMVLGVEPTAMVTFLGAAALAIAVGLRGMLANVAAGMMIITLRPMSVGDYIMGSGVEGTITELGLFNMLLKTSDGLYIFTPNSQIWGKSITNYSRELQRRINIEINITYEANIEQARKTIMQIVADCDLILPNPTPLVIVTQLGQYSVVLALRCWVNTSDHLSIKSMFLEKIKTDFDKDGIQLAHLKIETKELVEE